VLINNKRIEKIEPNISLNHKVIENDGEVKYFRGVIDDQVHFCDSAVTHKTNIYTEAKATIAGGVTSFREMQKPPHQHLRKIAERKV